MSLDSREKGGRQAQLFVTIGISALDKTLYVGRFHLWSPTGKKNPKHSAWKELSLLSGKLIALPSADRQFATREA